MTTEGKRIARPAGDYKVGYGKPPEEFRFGRRPQPNRDKRQHSKEQRPDIASLLDRPMRVKLNGKQAKMHPHEAMLHGLFARVVAGEIRAIKLFLQECKRAGLLERPPAEPNSGVVEIPKEVPMHLGGRLVRIAVRPPWDDLYVQVKAEYERDCAYLAKLKQEAIAKARANGKEAY
jgi:hypothetical protein